MTKKSLEQIVIETQETVEKMREDFRIAEEERKVEAKRYEEERARAKKYDAYDEILMRISLTIGVILSLTALLIVIIKMIKQMS